MNLAQLHDAWPQLRAAQVQPFTRGTNNLMYRVETAEGVYVLRVAGASVQPRRLHFEYDVLSQLARAQLPFALPLPLPTTRGEIYAHLGDGSDAALVTLTPLIAGEHPARDDLERAEAAGAALALLDNALGAVAPEHPEDAVQWRSTGDLAHVHPFAPEPRAAFATLPIAEAMRRRLVAGFDALMARIPTLYANLPVRLSHEDYDPSNVLMEGARVTGVVDWEFCARDLRAMDLVVALTWWPVEVYGSGAEWPILAALLRGYGRHAALERAEVAAIPDLFRLRAYTSLIHRLGRQRQGLRPLEDVVSRAEAALQREDWLQVNGERLTQLADEALVRR